MTERQDGCARTVRRFPNMRSFGARNVLFFMENKTFCSNCRVHCYKPEMREKIREVMRFSGPRMLLCHPILAVWHVVCSVAEKKKQKREGNI